MSKRREKKLLSVLVGQALGAMALSAAGLAITTGSVYAQSADGSVYGRAKAGAAVTLSSPETGISRQVKADANGAFSISRIPPGTYVVTSEGVTRDVVVSLGSGTQVNLDGVERIQVTGSRVQTGIDVSSVESNTVFTAEQIRQLPVPHDIKSVALLAPGVVMGDADFQDDSESAARLPAFGGASVAENGYYINGFDVTNIRNFLSYATLPFDAIEEQQIKSGGYSAEYGRSLGGVISLLTKRGTNEWKGGVSVAWEPKALRAEGKNVRDLEPTRPDNYRVFQKDDEEDNLTYNIYGGGPIIKDKLFIFGLIEGKREWSNNYGQTISTKEISDEPNGMVKIDFMPTDAHRFEFTGINNKKKVKLYDYTNTAPYSTSNDGPAAYSIRESGGSVLIGKYTGYLTNDLTVSALVGQVDYLRSKTTGARTAGQDCPVVLDEQLNEVGCWSFPFPGLPVRDPAAPDDKDKRTAWRLDIDYVLGAHTLRGGFDSQVFETSEAGGSTYSGGHYYRYFVSNDGKVNGVANAVAPGGVYIRDRVLQSTTGAYKVENDAFYIEDTWQIHKNLSLYGGLRWESFNNKNGDGTSFVKADNLLAPRFGAAWDVNGDATFKVFGTAGRYFIPVASNSNVRMTRGEIFTHTYYSWGGQRDPRTQGPVGPLTQIGIVQVNGDGTLPDPATVADTNLQPMSQDEFILGFQKALVPGWTFGAKYIHRKVNNGMDDWCDGPALERWALANGYPDYDYHSAAQCVLVNPGNDVHIKMDLNNDGNYQTTTIPSSYTGLEKYERKYDALELTLAKAFDGKWGFQGSYTYSKAKGTAEGYVNSIINQDDAGVTQEFDFGSFTHGAYGFLPNDRRHILKMFGTMSLTPEWRIGMNLSVASGRPTSCIGFVPPTVVDYAGGVDEQNGSSSYSTASTFYCLDDNGNTHLVPRGSVGRTPWTHTLDLQVAYTPNWVAKKKLTLQMDVFNVFNNREAIEFDEIRDFSRQTSITPPGQLSMNYGQPTAFQTPRYVRLSARWEF